MAAVGRILLRLVYLFFAVLLMALSLNALRASVTPVVQYISSQGWAQTEGDVLQSGIEVVMTADGTPYYHANVDYRYTVNGETYSGERLLFGYNWDGPARGPAQQVVDRYPVGQTIMVFYNPADPSQAVVERRVGRGPLIALPLALLFTAGTVGIPLYVFVRSIVRRLRGDHAVTDDTPRT